MEILVEMKEAPSLALNGSLRFTNCSLFIYLFKNLVVQLSKMEEHIPYRMEKVCSSFSQVHFRSPCSCEVHGCYCLTFRFCHLFLLIGFQCSSITVHSSGSFFCPSLSLFLVDSLKCTMV